MGLILSIGFCITGFTIFLLLNKKENRFIQRFAVLILSLWFLRFVLYYLKAEVNLSSVPWVYLIDQNLFFLDGVFLYWFAKSLNQTQFRFQKEFVHLLPFIILSSLSIALYISISGTQIAEQYQEAQSQISDRSYTPAIQEVTLIVLILIHNTLYVLFGYKNVSLYNQNLFNNYSTLDKVEIKWLLKFFAAWVLLLLIPLILYFINYLFPLIQLSLVNSILIGSLVLLALFFSVNVINQYYASFVLNKGKAKSKTETSAKYMAEYEAEFFKLKEIMKLDKPYLDEGLTLAKLSELINVRPARLSNIIKTQTDGNFYDFVNEYRIEAVKEKLLSSDEQVIIIAYQNGFNSKSTFNKVFKTFTGYSPSEFRKASSSLDS